MAVMGKPKGSAYERKIAKDLSLWMFSSKYILKRDSTSGALKDIWAGDIVPHGQLPDIWNKRWMFIIETKTGYCNHKPTFWNYTQIHTWACKLKKESVKYNQYIMYLICQFKNMPPLLFTNYLLNSLWYNVSFPIHYKTISENMYCYKLSDVLKIPFYELYDIAELVNG
jgi:hypothetical protein